MVGRVYSIFISPDQGQPMLPVEEVRAIVGVGLAGDRYALNHGFWSSRRATIRHVSLIALEQIQAANEVSREPYHADETRRNIITMGVDLDSLLGRLFWVGSVGMRGVELCDPCDRPSQLLGREGFAEAFVGRGGLRASILTTGFIRPGNDITVAGCLP